MFRHIPHQTGACRQLELLKTREPILRTFVLNLIAHRLLIAGLTLLIVSFAVFFATAMLPGDTASILLGQAATPEAVAGLRAAMHLDEPAVFRFFRWLAGLAGSTIVRSENSAERSVVNEIGPARYTS